MTCATPGRHAWRSSRAPRGWPPSGATPTRSRRCATPWPSSAPSAATATSFAANRSFHLALAAASGNPHLTRFAEMLWVPRIGVPIYQAQAAEPSGATAWADEHERIVDAIEAGDADAAERLTREHVSAHPPVAPDR